VTGCGTMTGTTWQGRWMRAAALSPEILHVTAGNELELLIRRLQI
jgi:hypothetical protein